MPCAKFIILLYIMLSFNMMLLTVFVLIYFWRLEIMQIHNIMSDSLWEWLIAIHNA